MTGHEVGRRGFLATVVAVAVTACGTSEPVPRAVRTPPPAPVHKRPAGPVPVPEPELPALRPWAPQGDEVSPEVKLAATGVLEVLGTVPPDPSGGSGGSDGGVGAAARRLSAAGGDPALAQHAGPLLPPATPAVAEIVYPQYGGLETSTASVMTVLRQTWVAGAELAERLLTVDVRLTREAGGWAVTELLPVQPAGIDAAALSGPAADLAAQPRVMLPDAALADLAAGIVDPRVTGALLQLAQRYELAVTVFRSGHPENVFGTDRISNHTRGRAVDIWAVDGRPVASIAKDDPFLLEFLAAVRATGSDEIGGPVDPDGPGGDHFADELHRDHVHLGFERPA